MAYVMTKERGIQARARVRMLLNKPDIDGPDETNIKREKLLNLLKKRYGYTNEKAVDELERLLKLFSKINKSSGIRHTRPRIKHTPAL